MSNSIQACNSIELSRRDKERQEQRLLSYVRRCAERKGAGRKVSNKYNQ